MVQNMPQKGKGDDIGKIFVGGLHQNTTEEGMQSYFQTFGDVADCVLMRDPATKKSRGFGFVTFADPSVIQDVLNKRPHTLDHKQIDPKPAVPRGPGESGPMAGGGGGGGGFGGNRSGNNAFKVFVGGIASNTTEDDLKSYFDAYGTVANVTLMYDKESGRMRGFGFVAFDSKESVDKTAHIHYHQINGKTVEVKRAQSRDQQQQRDGPPGMGGPMGGMQGALSQPAQPYGSPYQQGGYGQQPVPGMGRGYGMGGYGQYGAAPGQPPAQPQGYGAVAAPGAAPGAGYGYGGLGAGAMLSGYGATPDATASMYARGPAPGRDVTGYAPTAGGYGATGYAGAMPPVSAAPGPAAPATGYPDYGQVAATAASTASLQPHAGTQQRAEVSAVPDYSAYSSYSLGSYQQQDSAYGPSRGPTYATAGESGYSASGYAGGVADANYTGAAAGYGDQSFGRGAAATRGYHPYGR